MDAALRQFANLARRAHLGMHPAALVLDVRIRLEVIRTQSCPAHARANSGDVLAQKIAPFFKAAVPLARQRQLCAHHARHRCFARVSDCPRECDLSLSRGHYRQLPRELGRTWRMSLGVALLAPNFCGRMPRNPYLTADILDSDKMFARNRRKMRPTRRIQGNSSGPLPKSSRANVNYAN